MATLRWGGSGAVAEQRETEAERKDAEGVAALLTSWGLPPERWDDYPADMRGMVELAMDAYFATLREGSPSPENVEAQLKEDVLVLMMNCEPIGIR
jgi:hypothetical protein